MHRTRSCRRRWSVVKLRPSFRPSEHDDAARISQAFLHEVQRTEVQSIQEQTVQAREDKADRGGAYLEGGSIEAATRGGARRHPQGRLAVPRRRRPRRRWRVDGPHFLGHIVNHLVLDPRDGRTLLAAAKHRPPRPDRVPLDRPRPHLEGSRAAAGVPEGAGRREGPRRRPHLLAHAGPRERAGRLVRRHLAAGPVPLRGRRRHLGAAPRPQRRPAVPRVDGRRAGRHAGRAEAALGHRRPARPGAPLPRHVERRRARVARRRRDLDAAQSRASRWSEASIPRASAFTTRTACGSAPATRTGSTSRTTAASTASTGPSNDVDAHRQEHAEAGRRHRLSDGGAPARRRHGLGVPDGRHHGLAAHQPGRQARRLRHAQRRQDLAAPGRGPAREPGLVDGEAPGDDGRRARPGGPLLRHDQRRAVGEPRRRRALDAASRGTCPRSTRSKRPSC